MSDFVNGFWSVYVALLTLVSVVGCGVFLWVQGKARATAASTGEVKTMGHVWDGDLEEYNNPLPRWWLHLFNITIIFALVYLVFFPGLGNFAGVLGWTGAVAAYGPFAVSMLIGASIAATGSAAPCGER